MDEEICAYVDRLLGKWEKLEGTTWVASEWWWALDVGGEKEEVNRCW